MAEGLWACGTVGRAHGLDGAFYLDLLPGGLGYLTGGEQFFVDRPDGPGPEAAIVARIGGTDLRPLVRMGGVDDREAVSALRGAILLASGPGLDEGVDHYPVRELIGCRAVSGDTELGVVEDVLVNPAHDILDIRARDGARTLVPFVAELVEVDREGRVVLVREGLL